MNQMKAVFFQNEGKNIIDTVYGKGRRSKLENEFTFPDSFISNRNLEIYKEFLKDVEIGFSTWEMPVFTREQIREFMPSLKIVFYGAGSVQHFARSFLNEGVRVMSAWAANGVAVAEFAVAQIILANKGTLQAMMRNRNSHKDAVDFCAPYPGTYGCTVGIIGAGMIGSLVISMLKAYNVSILIYDPFVSDERSAQLGVEKVSLERIFTDCLTISNHLADNEHTRGILNGHLFDLMKDNATFINTGRGAQVVEQDLIKALKLKPARTAILDVTYPEPPVMGHEFYSMPNVFLTPHIAGSKGDEVVRMADYVYEECKRYIDGLPLKYEVTLGMLDTMA
jgi:phosphoglycerate dehydrogenase-like enzyme